MPFKKPPQDMDHLTRRFGPSKKDRERQAKRAAAAASDKGAAVEDDDAQKQVSLSGREGPTKEPVSASPVAPTDELAELPRLSGEMADPEPEPKAPDAPPGEPTAGQTATGGRGARDGKPSGRGVPGPTSALRRGRSAAGQLPDERAVEIRGYVYAPMPGASDEYDKLVSVYGEKDALRLAIVAGLGELDRKLVAGDPVEPVLDYSSKKERRRIQRKLSAEVADRATAHLDPLGMLSQYAFGTRLWKTVLGLYLAKG